MIIDMRGLRVLFMAFSEQSLHKFGLEPCVNGWFKASLKFSEIINMTNELPILLLKPAPIMMSHQHQRHHHRLSLARAVSDTLARMILFMTAQQDASFRWQLHVTGNAKHSPRAGHQLTNLTISLKVSVSGPQLRKGADHSGQVEIQKCLLHLRHPPLTPSSLVSMVRGSLLMSRG